ncbi:reverse transcriptase domain-containing protein [Tanacetum coccineum]
MRTRSQTRNRNRQQQAPPAVVESFNLEEPFDNPPLVPMADNRTMAKLLQAPTEGYEDAIVIPKINANFELKHGSTCSYPFYFQQRSLNDEDFPDIPKTQIHNQFLSSFEKSTILRNENLEISTKDLTSVLRGLVFLPWDRFNDLLRACPHHGFSELHQLDTFYNALNANDQDSLNSAAGGNFLDKMPRECLKIIESKSKVRNSRNKAVVAKVSSSSSTPGISPDVAALTTEVSELKNMMKTMLIDKQKAQAPVPVKAVEQSCVTCGIGVLILIEIVPPPMAMFIETTFKSTFHKLLQLISIKDIPILDLRWLRTKSDLLVFLQFKTIKTVSIRIKEIISTKIGEPISIKIVEYNFLPRDKFYQPPTSQPPVYQAHPYQAPAPQMQGVSKTDFDNYVKANDAVLRNMQNQGQGLQNQMKNLTKMLSKFVNSNTALTSSSGPTIPTTPSHIKLSDVEPRDDKGTGLFLLIMGITEDVHSVVPVGKPKICFQQLLSVSVPTPNPKPSIPYPSRRIDENAVWKINLSTWANEAITYNLDQTSRYSVNYNDMTAKQIDVVELACEEYSQEVLGFSNVIAKADAFLALANDPTSPEVDESYYDPEGDILILEALLNSDPSPPPNQGNYLPEIRKELKICEAKTAKSSLDETSRDLSVDEKTALIKVLKSRKRAIAWKLSDINGIKPKFCSHKILMEEDYEPTVQHQRRVNPKIHDVIKKELNEATRKDHFPLPFMDQMLERLAGNEYYCFLDGFSGYFQIPIDPKDQEKTTFTCPYGTFAYRRMPFGLCNAPGTFQRCMMAIFHDMIEKTMEVFMDDFSVFGNSFSTCLSNLEKNGL